MHIEDLNSGKTKFYLSRYFRFYLFFAFIKHRSRDICDISLLLTPLFVTDISCYSVTIVASFTRPLNHH